MALKPYNEPGLDEVNFFMFQAAERGGFAVINTGGSGQATDQGVATAVYATNPSGKYVLGVLVQDVHGDDLTKRPMNRNKREVPVGSKVFIKKTGVAVTNMIYPAQTPAAGNPAYLGPSGLLVTANGGGNPKAGTFLGTKDADGFVKVQINQ